MAQLSVFQAIAHAPWWLAAAAMAALALHIGGGLAGILAGTGAVTVRKGERLHRRFGTIFVLAMLTMAGAALTLAVPLHQVSNIAAALLVFYLVSTSWMAARRSDGHMGAFEKGGFVAVLGIALLFLSWGVIASASPHHAFNGYASVFYYVFAGIAGLFALIDLRAIRRGTLDNTQRIARHLWRMCFAFFFATGSFFLGQQKVMPASWHGATILWVLGLAPLGVLLFWTIRVRFKPWRAARIVAAKWSGAPGQEEGLRPAGIVVGDHLR
jgi:uncharacterized membrane protein